MKIGDIFKGGLFFQIIFWLFFLDVVIFRLCFNFGFPSYFAADDYYIPAPYVMHVSKQIANSSPYNRRYKPDKTIFKGVEDSELRVAFFAGSTGILGEPSLTKTIENELSKKMGKKCFVANFSAMSGNSKQHTHMLLEYLDTFKPDVVVFYNGFNELIDIFTADRRPGYPYNQFYIEQPEWKKALIKYSAIFGELEEHFWLLTRKKELSEQINFLSYNWMNETIDTYLNSLEKAKKIVENGLVESTNIKTPVFIGVFQPFKQPFAEGAEYYKESSYIVQKVREKLVEYDYLFDFHDAYNDLNEEVWTDFCHVQGEAHSVMAEKISDLIYEQLTKK